MKRFFYHLFVPNEKNNHRALLLKPSFLGVLIAFYLLNLSLIKTFTIIKPGVLGYSSEITIQKIFEKTNLERQKAGLPALKYNSTLSQSAALKAQDMFTSNYWAHNSPSGKTPWDFFKAAGYKYSVAGENLAKDFSDSDSVIKAWMNSPTHKANIVHTKYQEIGIGVVNGTLNGVKTTLVVQHFGTPAVAVVSTKNQKTEPKASTEEIVVSQEQPTVEEKELNSAPFGNELISTQVLSNTSKTISPLFLAKIIGTIFFVLIMAVVFIDGYVTIKNKTYRLAGSATGHIGFLVIIFFMMLFLEQGRIF